MVTSKAWLSELRAIVGTGRQQDGSDNILGILSFEAAATMSRLVSLHRSLSDTEIFRLRSETLKSQGITYLVSSDQSLLLRLACAEMLDELDSTADIVSRLGGRCKASLLREFGSIYADLKIGSADRDPMVLQFSQKGKERRAEKMERYVDVTTKLCKEMEVLEASEQKLNLQWNQCGGSTRNQKQRDADMSMLMLDLKSQRQKIRRLKEESLWNQTCDTAAELMARAIVILFARICSVFGPFVPGLPTLVAVQRDTDNPRLRFAPVAKLRVHPRMSTSGPIDHRVQLKEVCTGDACPVITKSVSYARRSDNWVNFLEPPESTVGDSGLELRYADVIVLAGKLLALRSAEGGDKAREEEAAAREELYGLLTVGLRRAVKAKLKDCWRDPGPLDTELAEGWREAVGMILAWLGPVAHDTIRWHVDRNMDWRRRFDSRPRALMLQTLHFADREKTEAAIVEVLVGLSLACWCEDRQCASLRVRA